MSSSQNLAAPAEYERAVACDATDALAWLGWADALCHCGQHKAALEKYATAAKLAANNPQIWKHWGTALKVLGQHAEARTKLAKAADLENPSSVWIKLKSRWRIFAIVIILIVIFIGYRFYSNGLENLANSLIAYLRDSGVGGKIALLVMFVVIVGLIWGLLLRVFRPFRMEAMARRLQLLYTEGRGEAFVAGSPLDQAWQASANQVRARLFPVNTFHGEYQGRPLQFGDYCYPKEVQWNPRSILPKEYRKMVVIDKSSSYLHVGLTGARFVNLYILPESGFSSTNLRGYLEQSENSAFARRFSVTCEDAAFARAVLEPKMQEFLLKHRRFKMELDGGSLEITADDRLRWSIGDFNAALEVATGFLNLLPADLWQAHSTPEAAGAGQ